MATQPQVTEEVKNQPEMDEATGKLVYTYQPRDKDGQFIGKPYKFLYTDQQDLVRQLTDAKENGDRYIHEVKTGKRQVNGEPAVPRPEFKPAPESAEEADKKRREDFRKTAEEEFGAPLDEVRKRLKFAGDWEEYQIGQKWALENEANGYYICPENAKKIGAYLREKNLKLTPANLDLALEELRDSLAQKPQQQTEAPADSTQQPPTRAEVKPQSTGIIPGQFQGTRPGARQEKKPLTVERFRQIRKMTYTEYKRLERANPDEVRKYNEMILAAQPQQ